MNINTNTVSISFTLNELWFIVSQFQSVSILGIENPYIGCLAEEIKLLNNQAIRSLVDRDIVHVLTETTLEADDTIVEMVHTCAVPDHTLLIQTQTDSGQELRRYIHFRDAWIVEHIQESEDKHRLTVFKDRESLCDYLSRDLRVSSPSASQGKPFFLAEETLFSASQSYAKGQDSEGLAVLEAGGLDKDIKTRLAATLADPVANASFTFIMNMQDADTQYVKGFGLLEGKGEFWMLSPCERSGQRMVEFIPVGAALVHQRFIEMLPA